ncbi:MAG TPA: phosphotransferase family protein [Acidimicrobiales bacterium]|nr:phosphotransferase family protein [Acidimicrobiales bacterium]
MSAAVDLVVPPAALAAWLAVTGLADAGDVLVDQLAGGASNLTFRVRTGAHDWVLRRPPAKGALPTAHDVLREHRIQAALGPTAVPVPRMVAACADTGVIGAPFYLMERVDGTIYASAEAVAALTEADATAISSALVRTLATLHAVDPEGIGLGELRRPEPFVDRQLRRWQGQWERSRAAPLPALDDVFAQLGSRRPAPGDARIVHGDYNLANVMFSGTALVAVLDWELAALGDALADVGALLAYWGEAGRLLFARRGGHLPDANPGMISRAQLVSLYEEASGAPAHDVGFFEAMATAKLAVICAGALLRADDQSEERRSELWDLVGRLAEVAREALG